ncbi:type II toxin-antitoxin system RelE/ParE family toxin [Candidatus Bathyarchaeota archaeon]|nr:type II toxin-antitoxin system RelE/ParE family toxin [Candidatus Bathyarchaeota archaeon]
MPSYKVLAHRRVHKYLKDISDEKQKKTIYEAIERLEEYPFSLAEMDIATIRGAEQTFRIRVGRYRIIFGVDKKDKTIYVTHVNTRKRVYKKK